MTAEIVDLGRYREQKKQPEKVHRRRKTDRWAGDGDRNQVGNRRMDDDETTHDSTQDHTHDSTHGGEPA